MRRASDLGPALILTTIALAAILPTACDYPRQRGKEIAPTQLRAPANNAYLGSIFDANSLRPSLRWEPLEETDETSDLTVTYQVELSPDEAFTSEVIATETTESSYSPASPLPVATTIPVGQRYYWRVRTCIADEVCSDYSATWWFNLGRSKQDYDGDGLSDAIVGAPFSNQGFENAGRAYIYLGTRQSIFPDQLRQAIGGQGMSQYFGDEISPLGDVNGDGFSDFAVGAPGKLSFGVAPGRAYIYFGKRNFWLNITHQGVISGQGLIDRFGERIEGVGDLNGDGFSDVAIYTKYEPGGSEAGFVNIYLGGPGASFDTTLDAQLVGEVNGDDFGSEVVGADLNRDGFSDLAIGAWFNNTGGESAGRTYIYFGSKGALDTTPDGVMTGLSEGALFGANILSPGDMNQDGFDDLVISADIESDISNTDLAYIYHGGADVEFDMVPDRQISIPSNFALKHVGDFNGDGQPDFFSAPYLYLGNSEGAFDVSTSAPLIGGSPQDAFGGELAALGDLNGDGVDDLIVGATADDTAGMDFGRAYIYFGSRGGVPDLSSDGALAGHAAGERFGSF